MPACNISESNMVNINSIVQKGQDRCHHCLPSCKKTEYDTSLMEDSYDPEYENDIFFGKNKVEAMFC